MIRGLRAWVDPFIVALIATMVAGLLIPTSEAFRDVLGVAAMVAVVLLFFVYGLRLQTTEVLDGLRNVRLQGGILGSTFVFFPLFGLLVAWATAPLVGSVLATGLLFLTLLPSTVQSSVACVSIARGNIAGAICAATVSNVLGMVLTPLLVLVVMGGQIGDAGFGGVRNVLLRLLLPFVVGQLLQRWFGAWVRKRRWLTLSVDRGAILIVVFSAVASATAAGTWTQVRPSMLGWLLVISALMLAVALVATWNAARMLGLGIGDRIAFQLCGSQKSMVTGLPIAAVLFTPELAAQVTVPVLVFHQLQLITCAVLARRLARIPREPESVPA